MRYFLYDVALGTGIPASEAVEADYDEIALEWEGLSNEQGSFFGLFYSEDGVIQFVWDDADRVTVDIPLASQNGSLTKQADFGECQEIIARVHSGEEPRALAGLVYSSWLQD